MGAGKITPHSCHKIRNFTNLGKKQRGQQDGLKMEKHTPDPAACHRKWTAWPRVSAVTPAAVAAMQDWGQLACALEKVIFLREGGLISG